VQLAACRSTTAHVSCCMYRALSVLSQADGSRCYRLHTAVRIENYRLHTDVQCELRAVAIAEHGSGASVPAVDQRTRASGSHIVQCRKDVISTC
jgi:hypothetical protein